MYSVLSFSTMKCIGIQINVLAKKYKSGSDALNY